jgi:hypothetical protein
LVKPDNVFSSDSRGRRRRGPAQIAQLIADYQRSGLSQVQFCRERQLPLSSFTYWLRQPRRKSPVRPRRSRPGRPLFRQVDGAALGLLCGWAAEVVRPDGLIVRLSAHAPPQWARELLGVC